MLLANASDSIISSKLWQGLWGYLFLCLKIYFLSCNFKSVTRQTKQQRCPLPARHSSAGLEPSKWAAAAVHNGHRDKVVVQLFSSRITTVPFRSLALNSYIPGILCGPLRDAYIWHTDKSRWNDKICCQKQSAENYVIRNIFAIYFHSKFPFHWVGRWLKSND